METIGPYKILKTLRGYTALSRFMAELDESKMRVVPRPKDLPNSYFSFSPDACIEYWNGKPVVRLETSQAVFKIVQMPV